MKDIVKESCNIPKDNILREFTTYCNGEQQATIKLKKGYVSSLYCVTSYAKRTVTECFFTKFFALRYFKKLKEKYSK